MDMEPLASVARMARSAGVASQLNGLLFTSSENGLRTRTHILAPPIKLHDLGTKCLVGKFSDADGFAMCDSSTSQILYFEMASHI